MHTNLKLSRESRTDHTHTFGIPTQTTKKFTYTKNKFLNCVKSFGQHHKPNNDFFIEYFSIHISIFWYIKRIHTWIKSNWLWHTVIHIPNTCTQVYILICSKIFLHSNKYWHFKCINSMFGMLCNYIQL